MRGRYDVIDNRNKRLNGNFKNATRETAAIIYLRNDYIAAKEDNENRKKGIISASIIIAFLFFFIIAVMVSNSNDILSIFSPVVTYNYAVHG